MAIKAYRGPRFNADVLVIGIDVAKHRHVAVAESGGQFSRPLSFDNDWSGFEALRAWAHRRAERSGCMSLVFAMESTGHYHKPLEEWLTGQGEAVCFVSTLMTSRAKEMLDGSALKNDEKDACVIADLARYGKSLPIAEHDALYAELRYLGEFRQRLTEEKTQCLNRLHRVLDVCFPELLRLFKDLEGRAVRALLARASLPGEVVALGIDELAKVLQRASRGRLKMNRAQEVLEAAQRSIGCKRGVEALKREVSYQLRRLDELERELTAVEQDLLRRAKDVPYFRDLTSIPQLGATTIAVLLGQFGDLRQYRHARQLVKKAGLTLMERSSGQHKGKRRLSKRGRAPARHLLYLAALRMMKEGGPLHGLKLNHDGKPGTKLAMAGMKRLLCTLFAVAKRQEAFDMSRFEVKLASQASEKRSA